jgi:hypothetical protein
MKRFTVVTMAAAMVLTTTMVTARPAFADESADRYRTAMKDLVVLTDSWTAEMRGQVAAVAIKPEQACTIEYAELVQHGVWLADDLQGSALAAPAAVADANVRAGSGLRAMVDAAAGIATACDGSTIEGGAAEFEVGRRDYRAGMIRMRMWLFDGAFEAVQPIPLLPLR